MADETGGGWRMTRETKVGLVVAGSFLLLVGVVVFCKFREGTPPTADPRAEVKDEIVPDEHSPSEKASPATPPSPAATEVAVVPTPSETRPAPVVESLPPAHPPAGIVPDNDPRLSPPPVSGPGSTVVQAAGTDGRAPIDPLPPPVAPPAADSMPTPPGGGSTPTAPVLEPSGPPPVAPPESPPSGPPAVTPPTSGSLVTPPPPPPALDTLPPPAGTPSPAPADTRPPSGPVDPVPPPESRSATPPATDIRSVSPVPAGSSPPAAISPPVPADHRSTATTTGNPTGASLAPPAGAAPIPAASGGTTIALPTVRPVADDRGVRNPIPAAPAAPTTPPEQFVQGGRPIGTASGVSAPPITVSPSGARAPLATAPQVESFDEEEYRVKQGDTFQAISTRFYHTEKYAPALVLFNRNHPLASPGVRQEPPVLQSGQAVFLPPTRILEKRYGTVVPELSAPTAPTGGAAGERSSNASPGVVAPASTPSHPQYRVQGPDEMLWSIAQRYLGNGERWRDIHKLNPTIRPELPIAPGTVLTLPADAQAQPTARP